jgi:hypothetical protein
METPLRQPRTFWQWLTHQEGTLWVPPPPIVRVNPSRSALDAIETAIERIHDELDSFSSAEGRGYAALVARLEQLHAELVRRSKEESGETVPARQS